MPTARVPVPAVLRTVARNDDFMSFADADLVIAPRASVRLFRLIRLDVTDVDAFVGLGPAMRAHNAIHGTAASSPIDVRRGHLCPCDELRPPARANGRRLALRAPSRARARVSGGARLRATPTPRRTRCTTAPPNRPTRPRLRSACGRRGIARGPRFCFGAATEKLTYRGHQSPRLRSTWPLRSSPRSAAPSRSAGRAARDSS